MSSIEYERKFLVDDPSILKGSMGVDIEQGYVWAANGWAIRARRTRIGDGVSAPEESPAMVTIKGPRTGNGRPEYEVEVDADAASALIAATDLKINKTRYPIVSEEMTWVIDVFHGANEGLIVAELELQDQAMLTWVKKPWWAKEEVTMDGRYANETLAKRPWPSWYGKD